MINANMRFYDYFTIGAANEYGQPQLPNKNSIPVGQIKMAINLSTQATQNNINYRDCKYVGLTQAPINDSYIIKYGEELLKVLYINPQGRFKQIFMVEL